MKTFLFEISILFLVILMPSCARKESIYTVKEVLALSDEMDQKVVTVTGYCTYESAPLKEVYLYESKDGYEQEKKTTFVAVRIYLDTIAKGASIEKPDMDFASQVLVRGVFFKKNLPYVAFPMMQDIDKFVKVE